MRRPGLRLGIRMRKLLGEFLRERRHVVETENGEYIGKIIENQACILYLTVKNFDSLFHYIL